MYIYYAQHEETILEMLIKKDDFFTMQGKILKSELKEELTVPLMQGAIDL